MNKSFEIKGYINNVLKEIGLEGADAFDKALLLNALGKIESALSTVSLSTEIVCLNISLILANISYNA